MRVLARFRLFLGLAVPDAVFRLRRFWLYVGGEPEHDVQPRLALVARRQRVIQPGSKPPRLDRTVQRDQLGHDGQPGAERGAREKRVLELAQDVFRLCPWGRRGRRRVGVRVILLGERAIAPFVWGAFDGPRRCWRGRRDTETMTRNLCPARRPVQLIGSICLCQTLLQSRCDIVREKALQWQVRLVDKLGGDRFQRAELQVRWINVLGEERRVRGRERDVRVRRLGVVAHVVVLGERTCTRAHVGARRL